MNEKLERYMDATADLHGIPIDPAFRPGVLQFLALARDAIALVSDFPLPEDIEPAPRFEP
jgi:hypothetical protein